MKRILIASLMVIGMAGLAAAPASAFPSSPAPAPTLDTGKAPIVRVHGWHCRTLWAPGWGWHRNWRACRRYRRHYYRWSYRRRARWFCWHNAWSRRVCRRRY